MTSAKMVWIDRVEVGKMFACCYSSALVDIFWVTFLVWGGFLSGSQSVFVLNIKESPLEAVVWPAVAWAGQTEGPKSVASMYFFVLLFRQAFYGDL